MSSSITPPPLGSILVLSGEVNSLSSCDAVRRMLIQEAWTNFYRMYYAYTGRMHLISKKLHDQYGPVVRMAPNYIDVDYSSLIKTCFDVQGIWQKVRKNRFLKTRMPDPGRLSGMRSVVP
jgi:hypothetical protein